MTAKRRTKPAERIDPDMSDPVSLADAVSITGLNERTLRRHVGTGKIRGKREKRRLWLERADLEALATGDGKPGKRAGRSGSDPDLMAIVDALQEEKRGLLGEMVRERRELGEQLKLIGAGEAAKARELAELREAKDREIDDVRGELAAIRDRVVRAETAKRWAVILAAVLGAGVVALVVVLIVMRGAP